MSFPARNVAFGGAAISAVIAIVGLATDWFTVGVEKVNNHIETVRTDENRATRIETEFKAMQREWQLVRQENDKSDRNAQAITRLEEKIRELGSAPTSDNVGKAILQVTILQQRIAELEKKLENLSADPTIESYIDSDAIVAQVKSQLASLIDKAVAEKISDSGKTSGTDLRADAIASIIPDSDDTIENNGLLWEFQKCIVDGKFLSCATRVTNKTREDKNACISKAEIVTDTNYHTTEPRLVYVGEKWSYYNNVCSNIPPLVSVNSYIMAEIVRNVESTIRLLRYECGVGCQMAVYDKPVSQ